MLRSFAYAAAAASQALPQDLSPAGTGCHRGAPRGLGGRGVAGLPRCLFRGCARRHASVRQHRADADRVVRFFMLEKALYEIAYELANRPDWVAIPLRGVLALLDGETAPLTRPDGRRTHRMPFGVELQADGRVRFRLWAPPHCEVQVELGRRDHRRCNWSATVGTNLLPIAPAPARDIASCLPDGLRVPDPASRYQPEDVHGPSEVVDPEAYRWRDAAGAAVLGRRRWSTSCTSALLRRRARFVPRSASSTIWLSLALLRSRSCRSAISRVSRNWGYDGVLLYAPDSAYGRPEDLKALVEAAHARGLMVLLDVVYNHFGPEGAYIHPIAPQTFTDRHKTPWGAAINFDGPDSGPVREFIIHNALYWIEEFHLDGLRLDAVHAILDDSPKHLLEELAERVRAAAPDRHIHLILENEENQAGRLVRRENGQPCWYTAQWNDDIHHVLHVAASGETTGYYADYKGDTREAGPRSRGGLRVPGRADALSRPPARRAERRPAAQCFCRLHPEPRPGRQPGIRRPAYGFRTGRGGTRDCGGLSAAAADSRCCSWARSGARRSLFPFFCDFGPELADAVRQGRREEFARFPEFRDPEMRERIPDPMAEKTFASAKLGWGDRVLVAA